jgi:hypothetical protein
MIEGEQNSAAVAGEKGGEARARERISAGSGDTRNDRRAAARDPGADLPRFVKTKNARRQTARRQAGYERLDNALRAPRHEGRSEYLDARRLSRRRHRENRQR